MDSREERIEKSYVGIEKAYVGGSSRDPYPNTTVGPREYSLPTSPTERKTYPLYSGVLAYFPDALVEVAHVSWVGNQQHNPGQPLHWDRTKSTDEKDAEVRHLIEPLTVGGGKFDIDGVRHAAKKAWRALADLQKEIEAERGVK